MLTHIKTSSNYLNHLQNNVFVMIRQFEPPTFFVALITCENNLSILMKTLKDLYSKHFQQNVKIIFNDSLIDKDLV